MCSASILALPEGSKNFVVYCDASHKGLGAVLMQMEKVIAYASRQLKVHEKNYTTHDRELSAVVFTLKMWRHYMYDTKCVVFTDHKSLQHILDQNEMNMRQRHCKCLTCAKVKIEYQKPSALLEVVSKHEVPISIISNRDGKFTSHFWKSFNKALGTRLDMSTTYHPETDGQSEGTIQTLEDMLRACVLDFGKDRQLTGPEIIHETTEKIVQIKSRIQAARDRQKSYADVRQKPFEFQVGDKVMLKVSPWKGVIRFGKRGKLNPRYIGPFKIIAKVGTVAYRLELPEKLSRVHKPVKIMDREVKRLKQSRIPIMKVRWNSSRGREFT
uniref:Putative reverse transcriptase domain-containing protein n=1 Tax=Tanacetum cinerariifolium TaxID=118510 RepID=A0A699HW91_TANCI|nr:putative reverse transcriptase domain-containing protein [Tanacetum cinerariifolium]